MLHYFDNNPRCLFYMSDYKFKDNNLKRHNNTDFVKTIYILFNRYNHFRTCSFLYFDTFSEMITNKVTQLDNVQQQQQSSIKT